MSQKEYVIIEKMATGGFGVVFKVQRILDDQILVMKRIPLHDFSVSKRYAAAQESFIMSTLHYPYIVAQHDAFLFNSNDLCLVMDFYDGGDLHDLLALQRDEDRYFPLRRVMLWLVQLLLAVHYLHTERIFHRDIKPHNIFVDKINGTVAVGDFGVAEKLSEEEVNSHPESAVGSSSTRHRLSSTTAHSSIMAKKLTAAGAGSSFSLQGDVQSQDTFSFSGAPLPSGAGGRDSVFPPKLKGTPLYMAPEALEGYIALKSDVWSVGCILYELLCLRGPFEADNMAAVMMHVRSGRREPIPSHYPRCLSALLDSMLTSDPGSRPSCADVLCMPCVATYLELFLSTRTPTDVPGAPAEMVFSNQIEQLRQRVTQVGSAGTSAPSSHIPEYVRIEASVGTPQHPPSVERELAERRAVEAAAYLHTLSPQSSIGSAASAGAFLTANTPLRHRIHSAEFHDRPNSSQWNPPYADRGGGGTFDRYHSFTPPPQEPPLSESMRPHMIYDAGPSPNPNSVSPTRPPPHRQGRPLPSESMSLGPTPSAHRRQSDGTAPPPLSPLPLHSHQRRRRSSPDIADELYARYSNVSDMRHRSNSDLALEVWATRALVQHIVRANSCRPDAALLARETVEQQKQKPSDTDGHRPSHKDIAFTVPATADGHLSGARGRLMGSNTNYPQASADGTDEALSKRTSSSPAPPLSRLPHLVQGPTTTAVPSSRMPSMLPYSERRAQLYAEAVRVLGRVAFEAVYAYFHDHSLQQRDPSVVQACVPDRSQWGILPVVQEVLTLDRLVHHPSSLSGGMVES